MFDGEPGQLLDRVTARRSDEDQGLATLIDQRLDRPALSSGGSGAPQRKLVAAILRHLVRAFDKPRVELVVEPKTTPIVRRRLRLVDERRGLSEDVVDLLCIRRSIERYTPCLLAATRIAGKHWGRINRWMTVSQSRNRYGSVW